jgi:4a-hydroxytetrahydrobiopterin dehydratase
MTKPLDNNELEEAKRSLENWKFKGDTIHKAFFLKSFRDAIAFINRIGFEADEMGHHPQITNLYNKVSILLTTHDAGNKVTEKDIELASRIQALAKQFLK